MASRSPASSMRSSPRRRRSSSPGCSPERRTPVTPRRGRAATARRACRAPRPSPRARAAASRSRPPRAGHRCRPVSRDWFQAMGVGVVVGGATPTELEEVKDLFERLEATFSRFRAGSELNLVNNGAAEFVAVSPLFARALALALDSARRTDGLVDPTLGVAIEAAGYDRDFAELTPDPRPPAPAVPGSWRHVRGAGRLGFCYPGTKPDLHCIVKGLAVDAALDLLEDNGFVSAGGDVAVRGSAVVGLPGDESLTLTNGGLATSGTTRRRWERGAEPQHHLIDPRTGRPASPPWAGGA